MRCKERDGGIKRYKYEETKIWRDKERFTREEARDMEENKEIWRGKKIDI